MNRNRHSRIAATALMVGCGLLVVTLWRTDLHSMSHLARQLGAALPVALLPSAAWHLLRTAAWRRCFPAGTQVPFARIFRVRLAAEAFSFVTIRGVGGEPLKVVLLEREVAPATAAAAVALERVAYVLVTIAIVCGASLVAMTTLTLTPTWMRIFGVVGGVAALMMGLIVALLLRQDPASMPAVSSSSGAMSRFMRELSVQSRDLVHGERRRLTTLLALEAGAYAMMALEVWAVLRAIHISITPIDAMAVETFTRVASMASAVIPANVGALEASNVAGAAAIHATAGAAALALVRRLRGLIWCAGGFLVYPRQHAQTGNHERPRDIQDAGDPAPAVLVVLEDADADVTISEPLGGLPIGERIVRAAARAGYTRVVVWAPRQQPGWETLARRMRSTVAVSAAHDSAAWWMELRSLDPKQPVTLVAPGVFASPPILEAARELAPVDPHMFADPNSEAKLPPTGVFRTLPEHLISPGPLAAQLAHRRRPLLTREIATGPALSVRVSEFKELGVAERRMRESIFKPTDGRLGRFNRRMSIPVSVALIRWSRFSPHAMTVLIMILGLYAGWLFSHGNYATGLLAALLSLIASILDGCDGELARLQYKESAFGCWLDTLGDYTYYLAIFTGLTIGTVRQTGWLGFWWIGGALLVGSLLTFALLILLRDRITRGRPERLRSTTKAHFYATGKPWARYVVQLSTCATRATMPYGILAFAIAGVLPAVLVIGAIGAQIYWISLAWELRRLLDGPLVASGFSPTQSRSA
jgi:phosphatidylglycerophosphate synthase